MVTVYESTGLSLEKLSLPVVVRHIHHGDEVPGLNAHFLLRLLQLLFKVLHIAVTDRVRLPQYYIQ